MTRDITDQDEREAIKMAEILLRHAGDNHITDFTLIDIDVLRALLHRATRSHD